MATLSRERTEGSPQPVVALLSFTLFVGWLLAFAYQGQALDALYAARGASSAGVVLPATVLHALGLSAAGFFVRTTAMARRTMTAVGVICTGISLVLFTSPGAAWSAGILVAALLAGLWNSSWGYFYRDATNSASRVRFVARAIIGSTALMIVYNSIASFVSPVLSLGLAVVGLALSVVAVRRFGVSPEPAACGEHGPFLFSSWPLYLFILVLSVASGLMFASVNPAYAQHADLATWYWSVPYVVAVGVAAAAPVRFSRGYAPYAALAMLGAGFLAFTVQDGSVSSYLLVNTLLLGALGVFDLLWWGVLGDLFARHSNPARVLGLGLALNVLGVYLGALVTPIIESPSNSMSPGAAGVLVVLVAMAILPLLFYGASVNPAQRKPDSEAEVSVEPGQQPSNVDSVQHDFPLSLQLAENAKLTAREAEVLSLILRGYTYQLIAKELFISENTVKSHVRAGYTKLGIHTKTELIDRVERAK